MSRRKGKRPATVLVVSEQSEAVTTSKAIFVADLSIDLGSSFLYEFIWW
jgi:hypothetical protein